MMPLHNKDGSLRFLEKRVSMEIVKINQQNRKDINKANEPFEIIGQIILKRDWNGHCRIEEIGVVKSARGKGLVLL